MVELRMRAPFETGLGMHDCEYENGYGSYCWTQDHEAVDLALVAGNLGLAEASLWVVWLGAFVGAYRELVAISRFRRSGIRFYIFQSCS